MENLELELVPLRQFETAARRFSTSISSLTPKSAIINIIEVRNTSLH